MDVVVHKMDDMDATMILGLVITLYLSNRVRKSSCFGSKLSLHDVNVPLGGGFKHCLFSSLLGEMIQFD